MLKIFLVLFKFAVLSSSNMFHYTVNAQVHDELFITQGIASGDVTDDSAMIWSRANREALMHVQYDTDHNFSHPKTKTAIANQHTDFAAHAKLKDLISNSDYYYRVWFSTENSEGKTIVSNNMIGTFRTAPDQSMSMPISFVASGDLGGQGYCRRNGSGYSIFSEIRDLYPDFFLFLGDQIYADDACTKKGPRNIPSWQNIDADIVGIDNRTVNWTSLPQLHDVYLDHWEYNRNDSHLQTLLRTTSVYSQPDDHEVIDNYGGSWSSLPIIDQLLGPFELRDGYSNLVDTGISLFFNFSPIDRNETDPNRVYRSFSWGKDLDLFILDNRSYRDRNDVADVPNIYNKTMLGKAQLDWLKKGLLNSAATWKIVSTSVPVTVPTCFNHISQGEATLGCDSWATDGTTNKNFVSERTELFKFLDANDVKNVVFVTTDVHSPSSIAVVEDFNDDGDNLIFHELISGPLSAIPGDTQELDPTINASYLYNESRILNFGHIKIQKSFLGEEGSFNGNKRAHLFYEVLDENGVVRPRSILDLPPL